MPTTKFVLKIDTDDCVAEITKRFSQAWTLVGNAIKNAQGQQKQQHDAQACSTTHSVQLHLWKMFVYMSAMSGSAYKLVRPYHGPYSVVRVVENGIEVRPVDKRHSTTTLVVLNWVRRCTEKMPNVFWPQKDVVTGCHV